MFYLIYLFSSLILMCNYVFSNENPQKVTWSCGDKNCDTPIHEFSTSSKYPASDHNSKITFVAGQTGQIYKESSGIDYYFVKIGDKKGYVHKNFVRLTKTLNNNLVDVEGDIPPFLQTQEINPSKPTVWDGTTVVDYDNGIYESVPSRLLNTEVTPSLNYNHTPPNVQDSSKSTKSDIVDNNNNYNEHRSSDNVSQEGNSQGMGSVNAIENLDEDDDESVTVTEVEDEVENYSNIGEVSSQSESTNIDERTQIKSNINEKVADQGNDLEKKSDQNIEINQNNDNIETNPVVNPSISPEANLTPNPQGSLPENTKDSPENSVNLLQDNKKFMIPPSADQNIASESYETSKLSTQNIPELHKGPDKKKMENLPPENIVMAENSSFQINNLSSEPNQGLQNQSAEPPSSPPDPVKSNFDIHSNNAIKSEVDHEGKTKPLAYQTAIPNPNQEPSSSQSAGLPQNNPKDVPIESKVNYIKVPQQYGPNAHSVESTDKTEKELESQDLSTTSSPYISEIFSTKGNDPSQIIGDPKHHDAPQVDETSSIENKDSVQMLNQSNNYDPPQSHETFSTGGNDPSQTLEGSPNNPTSQVDDTSSTENKDSVQTPHQSNNYDPPRSHETSSTSSNDSSQTLEDSQNNPSSHSDETSSTEHEEPVQTPRQSNNYDPPQSHEIYSTSSNDPSQTLEDSQINPSSQSDETSSTEHEDPEQIRQDSDNIDSHKFKQNANDKTDDIKKVDEIDEASNVYASGLSFFSNLKELFVKSDLPVEPSSSSEAETNEITSQTVTSEAPNGYCYDNKPCGGLERPIGGEDQPASFFNTHYRNLISKDAVPLSFNSILYICITSVVLLLFSLGYYYIDKSRSSSYLVEKVNQLSHELFLTKKERDTLEDQLVKVKENCNIMDSSKTKTDSKLVSLQTALEESESAKAQLEENVIKLEKEIETLMDQGMEMHKLLSDTISDEERSQILLANIDELKESLSEKLDEIVSLTIQLDKKNEEIQLMQMDVRNANDRLSDMERKLESCKSETEEIFSKKLQDHQQQIIKLQQVLEEKGVGFAKLESELAKIKVERDAAEARASSAEAGLQSAHSIGAGEARQAWLDATSVRAALVTADQTNKTLQQNFSDITFTNKMLQDKISSLNKEILTLNSKYESVEKDKVNALTKLQVLSDYFKEKETQLQEELGTKESLWLQKESEDHTIYEQMKSLREEITSYKAQNEKLKNEILEQEAAYKVRIANEEQKSNDHWFSLRQADRKIKELQLESAHYRNRLTQLESGNNQSVTDLNPNGLDKGSIGASSPLFMFPPPPPSDFFPLPPPPLHPTASRPPPLGRISSPQLSGEMIPPPPLVPYMLPTSSTPPPSTHPLYKPQPRARPPPRDSPPSNYSSESLNNKSTRRRRR